MKKVLITLTAVLALTVATKYMTFVQAEEADMQENEAVLDNVVNDAINELNEVGNEIVNDAVEAGTDAGAASVTQ
jgi:cell division protein FtsL